jgi:putative flippase GtrA
MLVRFLRFNLVAAAGIVVRLAVAALLVDVMKLHYLVGTVLAIEASVLNNFYLNERWTFAQRQAPNVQGPPPNAQRPRPNVQGPTPSVGCLDSSLLFRCLAFHAGNGLVSVVGSLALMPFLVRGLGLHYLVANVVSLFATGLLNFALSDRLVFRGAP